MLLSPTVVRCLQEYILVVLKLADTTCTYMFQLNITETHLFKDSCFWETTLNAGKKLVAKKFLSNKASEVIV